MALKHQVMNSRQTGFTLVEVMIASFILFLVIASITLIYRGAVLTSIKAERTLRTSSLVGIVTEEISIQVRNTEIAMEVSGAGVISGYNYAWNATVSRKAKGPKQFNVNTGRIDQGNKTYLLWDVSLIFTKDNYRKEYNFRELSW